MSDQRESSPYAVHEERYLPEELGLDIDDQDDLALYVESSGHRAVGVLLLKRRATTEQYYAGNVTESVFENDLQEINSQIANYWADYEQAGT